MYKTECGKYGKGPFFVFLKDILKEPLDINTKFTNREKNIIIDGEEHENNIWFITDYGDFYYDAGHPNGVRPVITISEKTIEVTE